MVSRDGSCAVISYAMYHPNNTWEYETIMGFCFYDAAF